MNDPLSDPVLYPRIMDLFEQIRDSSNPEALLQAEPDPVIAGAVRELLENDRSAQTENFLSQPVAIRPSPAFESGDVLVNRFHVDRLLGVGGMGEVYLATDLRLSEQVALKTIPRLLKLSHSIRDRFLAEVQTARRVTHPNVCRLFEIFDEGDVTFYSMEFIDGPSLADILASERPPEFDPRLCALQLAEGLHAAHRSRVVHGDFKPSNVLIDRASAPWRSVITDFGLAQAFTDVNPGKPDVHIVGTLDYMAPELSAGGPRSIQSDIFAFGKLTSLILPYEDFWHPCLHLDPARRPGSLLPIIEHLNRKSSRRAWIIGSAAVALTGAATALFSRRRAGIPDVEPGARVIVNGFRGAAQAPTARLARGVFLTAIHQTARVRAIGDQDLLPALQRIRPGASLPAEGDVLNALLAEQRAPYWIDASLDEIGGRFTLSLHLRRSTDHASLLHLAFRDVAAVAALAQTAAEQVRRRLGESDRSLALNPPNVTSYTSEVPEALTNYYAAMEHYALAEMAAAVPLLEEAIRLDPAFAQAHNILGMCLNTQDRYEDAFNMLTRAFELSRNLPGRERAWIEVNYYLLADNPDEMVAAAQRNVGFFPDESRFHRILAYAWCKSGHPEQSLENSAKCVELGPTNIMNRTEYIVNLCEAGHFQNGLQQFQSARAEGITSPHLERGAGLAYMGLEDYGSALKAFEAMREKMPRLIEGAKIMAGNFLSAEAGLQQYLASATVAGAAVEAHHAREFLCGLAFVRNDLPTARQALQGMLALPPIPPHARLLQSTAFWANRLGQTAVLEQCARYLLEIETRWPSGLTRAVALHSSALLDWHRRDVASAEQKMLQSQGASPTVWARFDYASLVGRLQKWDLADEYWNLFDRMRGTILKFWFPGVLPLAWLERAAVAGNRADRPAARLYARKLLDHWGHAHPDLPLIRSARMIDSANT